MRTVVIVPIKSNSKRIKRKNFKKIYDKKLYRFILDKLKKTNFDDIYVDSDSEEIRKYCKKNNFKFIYRLPKLAKDNANGNDLLNYHANIIKADLYFQIFVTSPLLKISTINKCIKILKNSKKYDSILTSKSLFSWYWFNNKPINYTPSVLPRSQDAKPVVVETTGLYGIKKKTLKKYKCRIGKKPCFFEVTPNEALDIDNQSDFNYLNYLVKKRKYD